MVTRQGTDYWGRPKQGFAEIANSPPETPMPQRVDPNIGGRKPVGWGRQETTWQDITNPPLGPTSAPQLLPELPPSPEYKPYVGAFGPGNDTQLAQNLQLSKIADWGSLIKGPQAFQGSGLAALERATQRTPAGYTPWESLMVAKQRKEQGSLLGEAASQGNQATAGSRAALIARAGLRGGAAERLAGGAGASQAKGAQSIATQGMLGRLGIAGQAEGSRLGTLGQVSKQQQGAWGTEQSLKQQAALANAANQMRANQYDILNVLKEREAQDKARQFQYGQGVKKYIGQVYGSALGQIPPPAKGGLLGSWL